MAFPSIGFSEAPARKGAARRDATDLDTSFRKADRSDFARRCHHQAELLHLLQIPTRATMDAAEYLSDLCFALSCAILDRLNLHLILVADPLPIGAVSCSRLGMIVVQLVMHAARHAFGQKRGVIRIDLYRTGEEAECRVTDNGSAVPTRNERNRLRFVWALAATLNGSLESNFVRGDSSITVRFPYPRNSRSKTTEKNHRLRQGFVRDAPYIGAAATL